MNRIAAAAALLVLAGFANRGMADVMTISGRITQSTQDGTGPAVNNASLNRIADGDIWNIILAFTGSITSPGTYNSLPGASLTFQGPGSGAIEAGFGLLSLTISAAGGFDQFSLLGCVTSGSGCSFGNQLTASFQIPDTDLNSLSAAAIGLDQPHPLDFLEDDGTTDIQGSISDYSYTSPAAVPEPSAIALLSGSLLLMAAGKLKKQRRSSR